MVAASLLEAGASSAVGGVALETYKQPDVVDNCAVAASGGDSGGFLGWSRRIWRDAGTPAPGLVMFQW